MGVPLGAGRSMRLWNSDLKVMGLVLEPNPEEILALDGVLYPLRGHPKEPV